MQGKNYYKSIHNKHNYKFYEFDDDISSLLTFNDEEEVREKFFYPYLKKGLVFLDVGSQYGAYTLSALARGCKVIAINPPNKYNKGLLQNVKLNNYEIKQLFEYAAYNKTGYLNSRSRRFSTVIKQKIDEDKFDSEYNNFFPCKPIDSILLLEEQKIDFIKIDVEGVELNVLKGAVNIIKKNKPIILVENHLFIDFSLEEKCIEFIDSLKLGYQWKTSPYNQISHTLFFIH